MIDITIKQLESKIRAGMETISSNETNKLISITKQIEKHDPLEVFGGAKMFNKDRFFWMNADRTLTFTGVGHVKSLEARTDRYKVTESKWQEVIRDACIDNPYRHIPGTGIVAFGGMAFDPLKGTTKLWSNFKPSQFYIPEIILTEYKEESFLTVNFLVSQSDEPAEIADRLYELEQAFLTNMHVKHGALKIEKLTEIEPEKWKQTVRKATEEMKAKKAEKIVLAREVRLQFNQDVNIATVLENLYDTQANSYLFAFESNGDCFIGATPERLVQVEKKSLLSTCLAGTAPRGKTKEEDERIGYELLHDPKNREEHEFVVKMIKEAILKTCSNVEIPKEPVLHPLKNLQHLYTPVTGKLNEGYSIFDVVKDLHPTPALGGTPTEDSLAFIREHEVLDRGWYGAPIGWVDSNKNGEFAVAIRSGLIQGDAASLFAGCGVLADSNPEMEYEETRIKLLPMLNVLGGKQE